MWVVWILVAFVLKACLSDHSDDEKLALRTFRNIISKARKKAINDYFVGEDRLADSMKKRQKTFLDILEAYEVKKYARQLEEVMRLRGSGCLDWSCFDARASNTSSTTPVIPQTPPSEPETTTKKSWSWAWTKSGGWWR